MAERYSTAHRRYIVFIHSSVEGYLGCFGALAIVNSAALNIGVHVAFSSDICLGVGLLDHRIALFLVFKEPPHCFP